MGIDQIHLETSGKGEKITKENAVDNLKILGDVKQYLAKLSAKESASRLANPEIQKQITAFLEKAANNGLPKNLEKFNAKSFDIDGDIGLDRFKFGRFSEAMQGAIAQIVALDGMGAFEEVHNESKQVGTWTTLDKGLAKELDFGVRFLGKKGDSSFIEGAIKRLGTISPEELHKMSEKPFSFSIDGMKDISILLAKELGSGVEDMIRFVTNIPAGLILLPRYLTYRVDSNSSDIKTKTEGEIKLSELVEANSSLAIVELLGEKGIQMISQLASMMKSGKQGDIAMLTVTIAGLLAGGAGAVKLASSMARKSAVESARRAGSLGRTIEGRAMRNTLKDVSKTAGRVAEVAGKVDNIVSGTAAIGKLTKVVTSSVRQVAPALGQAANDNLHMTELERARAKRQAVVVADAVSSMEMQGTGTHGPASGPRMLANSYDGRSTLSLQNEFNYLRSSRDADNRLTPNEGRLLQEIHRRENLNNPQATPATVTPIKREPVETQAPIDLSAKLAKELDNFRDTVLLPKGANNPPLLYIERNSAIEIGRFNSMTADGKVMVEFIKDGKMVQKAYSLKDLNDLNNPDKRLSPLITPEVIGKRANMKKAYAKSKVNPLEILQNAKLEDAERIGKAEKILGRTLDQWEQLAIDHIHTNISKGVYNNTVGDLRKMYETWQEMTHHKRTTDLAQNKAQFIEFRKLVEKGILGSDAPLPPRAPSTGKVFLEAPRPHDTLRSPEIAAETEGLLHKINMRGTDFLEARLSGKPMSQAELNALSVYHTEEHASSIEKLSAFLEKVYENEGYTGDQAKMYAEAMRFAQETQLEALLRNINTVPASTIINHLKGDSVNASKILKALLENAPTKTKLEFFAKLENDTPLLSKIITSEHADSFIKQIGANTQSTNRILSTIINTTDILRTMKPEHLKAVDVILERMIEQNQFTAGLVGTLRSKLAVARDAKSPTKRIKNFLQNGDDETRVKLSEKSSPERAVWNGMFEEHRVDIDGGMKQLNMVQRGEKDFFHLESLATFFNMTFPELPVIVQKAFIKQFISPKDAKYHSLLEEFQIFHKELKEKGMI